MQRGVILWGISATCMCVLQHDDWIWTRCSGEGVHTAASPRTQRQQLSGTSRHTCIAMPIVLCFSCQFCLWDPVQPITPRQNLAGRTTPHPNVAIYTKHVCVYFLSSIREWTFTETVLSPAAAPLLHPCSRTAHAHDRRRLGGRYPPPGFVGSQSEI